MKKLFVYCIKCAQRFQTDTVDECPNCGCKDKGSVVEVEQRRAA
jgi:rRNA maturation endonuclease Nob1